MFIINNKQESGVSAGILTVWAEREGVSLPEIICEKGLPNDVTFQQMINVIECNGIDPLFKRYVVTKAQKIAKTDDDHRALSPYTIVKESTNQQSGFSPTNSYKGAKKSGVITTETLEEISALINCLTPEVSKKDKKEVLKKLDGIVCQLLKEANNNSESLFEIYELLPKNNKRIPYLKQKLLKLGKKHFL